MGKTSKNERYKLRATFFNNIAVGCVVAGILVPYLTTTTQNWDDFSKLGAACFSGSLSFSDPAVLRAVVKISLFIVPMALAWTLRVWANRTLDHLVD